MLIRLIHKCLDLVFPNSCFECGAEGGYLCPKCAIKISGEQNFSKNGSLIIYSAADYKNPAVKKLIWRFKYRRCREAGNVLASLITNNISVLKSLSKEKSVFLPIPISKNKLRERGYNQSALIASALSTRIGVASAENILYKKFSTLSQVETKTKKQRMENLKNSFAICETAENYDKNNLIILIDDIITTGATLNEAAKTLRKAGFKKIIAVTAARG